MPTAIIKLTLHTGIVYIDGDNKSDLSPHPKFYYQYPKCITVRGASVVRVQRQSEPRRSPKSASGKLEEHIEAVSGKGQKNKKVVRYAHLQDEPAERWANGFHGFNCIIWIWLIKRPDRSNLRRGGGNRLLQFFDRRAWSPQGREVLSVEIRCLDLRFTTQLVTEKRG